MHKKMNSAITVVLIVLLATIVFQALPLFSPKAYGAGTISDTAKMSPTTRTLTTLPETPVDFWVNVTSTGTTFINKTCIKLPADWKYTGAAIPAPGYGFASTSPSGVWVNFTTTLTTFENSAVANFSIPVTISLINSTASRTWTIYCYQGVTASSSNPVTVTVAVSLEFHASMSPYYVKGGKSYVYTVTVTNDQSAVGITAINITFPTGVWKFNALITYSPSTWTPLYNTTTNKFVCTGPPILEGSSLTIEVNMTAPTGTGQYYWNSSAKDSSNSFLGTYCILAVVASTPPTITPISPTSGTPYYSVGSGHRIWFNFSVQSTPNMAKYLSGYTVTVNDTRFILSQAPTEISSTQYNYYYENVTAIPDGHITVEVTAVDPATNTATYNMSTRIDNTKPRLISINVYDQIGYPTTSLYEVRGTFWMEKETDTLYVVAAFYNPAGFSGTLYLNKTGYPFTHSTNDTQIPSTGYAISLTTDLVVLNITLTDNSLPIPNVYTNVWNIKRETTLPSKPTYTKIQIINGGVIVWNLSATDNVGIQYFEVYYNGTLIDAVTPLTPQDLNVSTLTSWYNSAYARYEGATINNITIFDLFDWYPIAGEVANVTIYAVNYGSNVGPGLTLGGASMITVTAGEWYAMEMYPKWNLISFPLIPSNTATSNIYSLMLLHGAAGVEFTYGFNNATQQYVLNPSTMVDGKGYWVYMKAYDVLIVQGYPIWAPPGSPPSPVQYSLSTGWNLAGYTETYDMLGEYYVGSLTLTATTASYFRFVYVWYAPGQYWYSVDLYANSPFEYSLYAGQGFFIYMYSSQTLIPPIY